MKTQSAPFDQDAPPTTRETITPDMARLWLAMNPANRIKRLSVIERYARDMVAGKWGVTGDSIKFDPDGNLIDGQHRLEACVLANVPFVTDVTRGVTVHAPIDTGLTRTMADELRWRHEAHAPLLGAALNLIWRYERGTFFDPRTTPSRSELLQLLEEKPAIRESCPVGSTTGPHLKMPASVVAGLHFMFGERTSEEDATTFFFLARHEREAALDTGPYALRRYAHNIALRQKLRPRQAEWAAITIKAFNYWMEGVPVKSLAWRRGGARAEAFPVIFSSDEETE